MGESAHITHGESLWERLDVLRDKGSHGAKTCVSMSTFLKERASLENVYGQALIKASTRARSSLAKSAVGVGATWGQTATQEVVNWAPSLVKRGLDGVIAAVSSWGKQHVGWALCIDQNISKDLSQFAAKHQGHVARLWAEAQELVSDLNVVQGEYYRARGAYESACIDASRLLDERNKARENAAGAFTQELVGEKGVAQNVADVSPEGKESKTGGGSVLSSMSKMLEKVGEGMAMAVGIAAGDLTLEELEEKVPKLLENVDVAESEYVASIMAVNGYTTEFQPELEEKLNQLQLLEESRVMHVREVLLRLDQASKGMLDCLLGSGGPLEALGASLAEIDSVGDAREFISYVRKRAGLAPVQGVGGQSRIEATLAFDEGDMQPPSEEVLVVKKPTSENGTFGEPNLDTDGARKRTSLEIMGLAEDGVEHAFEAARDGTDEASRMAHEICIFLSEVVSVEETHARDLLRLLERHGYGNRVAQSGVTGPRGSIDLHAIGATMEDVGKMAMANMSGISPSTFMCAKAVVNEGETLRKGWDSSAVEKALVGLAAHTGLAQVLADESCPSASKVHEEAKAAVARVSKLFSVSLKQLAAAKSAHAKASARYEKICREVHDKEDALAKARVDLNTELQTSGASVSVPTGNPSAVVASLVDTAHCEDELNDISNPSKPRRNTCASDTTAREDVSSAPSSPRRDAPWLESLRLGQGAAARVQALESRLESLHMERDSTKHAVEDGVQGMESALGRSRGTARDIVLTLLSTDDVRQKDVAQVLDRILAALVETAKAVAAQQRRLDESEATSKIDGRKDVEELLERTAHRVPVEAPSGGLDRARSGQGDSVGEVMFMAYHSEVLQKERDLRRRTHLSPLSGKSTETAEDGAAGLRRAGGDGQSPFTAMAEAALAQAHAKRQQRRTISKRTSESPAQHSTPPRNKTRSIMAAAESSLTPSLTDGEGGAFPRNRSRRRRHLSRHAEFMVECLSDSEIMVSPRSLSRHGGGSLHGSFFRVSRHGSAHGSRHGSRNGSRHSSKHGSAQSSRSSSRHGKRTPDGKVLGARGAEQGLSKRITPTRETALVGDAYSHGELEKNVMDDYGQDQELQKNAIPVEGAVVAEQAEESTQAHPVSILREADSEPFLVGPAADQAPMPVPSKSVAMTDTSIPLSPGPRLSVGPEYRTKMSDKAMQGVARPDNSDAPPDIDAKDAFQTQANSVDTTEDKPSDNNTKAAAPMHGDRGDSEAVTRQGQFDQVHFAPMASPERATYAEVAIEDTSYPTEEYGIVPLKGRPSLHALRHRLSDHQDSFSSNGEIGLSSSDDEGPSPGSHEDADRDGFVFPTAEQTGLSPPTTPVPLRESLDNKVIESYSCALYSGGLPLHGRLSVTADTASFSGWRNTKVVLPLSEVEAVEKTSTLRIVPNALTLTKRDGEKITLGSFLYRDDCYTLLTRLVNVSCSISRLGGGSPTPFAIAAVSPCSDQAAFGENRGLSQATGNARDEPPESSLDVAFSREVAAANELIKDSSDPVVNAVLPCTVAQAFAWLWGPETDFWADFLRAQGEIDLTITQWERAKQESHDSSRRGRELKDLFPRDTFDKQRQLTFTHPRTGFVVGPKQVLTRQTQAYRMERRRSGPGRVGGLEPLDRVVLCQMTQMERAPMADHFTILGRVLMMREPPCRGSNGTQEPRCRLLVEFDVAFHKSTMLRGAIRSGAADESGTTWKAWLLAAEKLVAYQRHRLGYLAANGGSAPAPPPDVFDIATRFVVEQMSAVSTRSGGHGDADVADSKLRDAVLVQDPERKVDNGQLASKLIQSLKRIVAWVLRFAEIPKILILCCFMLIFAQQRAIRKLTTQVEDLMAAMSELHDETRTFRIEGHS